MPGAEKCKSGLVADVCGVGGLCPEDSWVSGVLTRPLLSTYPVVPLTCKTLEMTQRARLRSRTVKVQGQIHGQ